MKPPYASPRLVAHGRAEEITAFFGATRQGDVIRDSNDNVVLTGSGEVNGCRNGSIVAAECV